MTSTANVSSFAGPKTTIGEVGVLVARDVTWNKPAAFAVGSSNKTTPNELVANLDSPASTVGAMATSDFCLSLRKLSATARARRLSPAINKTFSDSVCMMQTGLAACAKAGLFQFVL